MDMPSFRPTSPRGGRSSVWTGEVAVIDVEVTEGYAVRITTGAPVPRGADAVIRVENTELAEDHVIIHQDDVAMGENIRPIGSDVRL